MQQPSSSKTKTYGIVIIVVLVFVLIYFYFSGSTPAPGPLVAGSPYGTVGGAELALLNHIRSLRIDTAIFTDPAFKSLVDYSVSITPENVGRPNPFAPLPGVQNPASPQSPAVKK